MNKMRDLYGTFFYKSAKILSRNKFFLFIIIILDYSQVLFPSFELTDNVIKYLQTNPNYSHNFLNFTQFVTMLNLTKLLSNCNTENTTDALRQCILPSYFLYIISGLIVIFYIYLICTHKQWITIKEEKVKNNTMQSILKSLKNYLYHIFIYFYNIIFFRLFALIIIDIILNFVINSIFSEIQLVLFIFPLQLLCVYCYTAIVNYQYIHIYVKLDNNLLNFPFDSFSSRFDYFALYMKLFISLEHNFRLQLGKAHLLDTLDVPMFFGISMIALMVIITVKWLIELFASKNSLLYYTNTDMNLLRLFLCEFNTLTIISILVCRDISNYTIVIAFFVVSFLLSLFLVRYCGQYRETKALTSGNPMLLMLFLLDYIWYGYEGVEGKKNNYQQEYTSMLKKVIICHLSTCKKTFSHCSFCTVIKSTPELSKYTYDMHSVFFTMLYDLISSDKMLIDENQEQYRVITFFHKSKLHMNNPFNHSMNIIKAIQNSKIEQSHYLNMKIYYRNYIKCQKIIIVRVESINFIEKKTNELYDFINKFENLLYFEEKKPTTVIEGATYLYKLIKMVKKKLFNRLNSKNEYHSIIMQYIIESLTNTKLNFKDRTLFDISLYEEFLSDHFEVDKNIVLDHVYKTNLTFISLVGNDLIQFLKKPFSEIFHTSVREHAMDHFHHCVANTISNNSLISKNLFQFPISDKDNQSCVMSFKLKYSLMPSILLDSSLITGIYQINSDDVIVSLLDNKTKNEILLGYNKTLTRHIIIPTDFIAHLNQFHFPINIKSLFTSVSSSNSHNKDDVYSIEYKHYLPVVQSKLNLLLTELKDPAIQLRLPKIKDLGQYKTKVKKMHIKDKLEYQSSKSSYTCIAYLILNEDNTIILAKKDDFFSKFNVLEDNLFASFYNTQTTTTTGGFLNSNSSVDVHNSNSTSGKYMSGLSLEVRQRLQEDVTRKKKELKKFRILTHIILIFNSILVIITIAFLIFDIESILRFQNMFTFFQLWNKFICLFFNTSISIFANVCSALPKKLDCINNLDYYAESFNELHGLPPDFLMGNYLKYELTVKADLLQSSSKEVIRYIYGSMGDNAIQVLDADYHYRYITYDEKKLIVNSEMYSLLNGIDVYINLINSIVNNLEYTTLPIYIINIVGKNVSDIYLDNINTDSFSEVQMITYNIILNYPNFISSFMKLNDIMSNQLRVYINNCFNIINTFFILLIVIHMILFSICILFVNFFQNVIEDYYIESLIKISLIPLMIGLKEKLVILKDILMYFKEDPNKKIVQYNALVKKNTVSKSEAKSHKSSYNASDDDKKKKKANKNRTFTLFNGVIRKETLIILFSSFGAYFIYSIIFYLLLYYSITDYNHLIRTVDYGSNLDIYLYSAVGIIQMMIMTNQTDYEISEYLSVVTDNGYVRNLLDISYGYMDQIENDESYHQTLIPRLRDSIDLNCSSLFVTMQDELLSITDAKYSQRNYLSIMPKICSAFTIMDMKNDKLMINSIMYTLNKILLAIIHDIEPLFELKNSRSLFNLNVMVLMLYRPIRLYEAGSLNSEIINEMTVKYNTITYVYLLFNIFIEIVLFVLLRIYLIKKCIQIQKSMNMFVKCLKI